MAKVNPIGHIWSIGFNRYASPSFHDHFGQRYIKSIEFYIWPWKFNVNVTTRKVKVLAKVNHWSHLKPSVCFRFIAIGPLLTEIYQNPYLTLKIKVTDMAKVKLDGHIWGLEFNRYVLLLFLTIWPFLLRYSKFHYWPWIFKVKVTTIIHQNLIR